MRSKKTKKEVQPHRFGRHPGVFWGSLCLIVACVFSLVQCQCSREASSTVPATSTTIWPYGQPEYQIEVPEGYEGLLPASGTLSDDSTTTQSAPAGNSTESSEPAQQPEEIPQKQGERVPIAKANPARNQREDTTEVASTHPTLIIVIDDVGYNLKELEPFLKLPFPITVAVLPQVDHTKEAAQAAKAAGKEVILHQPMQALGGNNPGPGAIYVDSNEETVRDTVTKNLDEIPEAVGMNNHMGSAVTRDSKVMHIVLDIAKSRGIYYLDSLTTSDTVTASICRELSMPYWERDVFLDNKGDRKSIRAAVEEGKKIASSHGAAVLIGHVWSAELAQTLMDIYSELVDEGYSLSTISHYMLEQSKAGEKENARPGD
ncbi:MAG: divergent polysaccharide deacetylase family protein [Rectinema sp.]